MFDFRPCSAAVAFACSVFSAQLGFAQSAPPAPPATAVATDQAAMAKQFDALLETWRKGDGQQAVLALAQAIALEPKLDPWPLSVPRAQQKSNMMVQLARVLQISSAVERGARSEVALSLYEKALAAVSKNSFPAEWGDAQHGIGAALIERAQGDRSANLERAIKALESALEVRTKETVPQRWAETLNSIAIAYRNREAGNRADNIESAIAAYGRTLEVFTREVHAYHWATAHLNLAVAHAMRVKGSLAQNIDKAIEHNQIALTAYDRTTHQREWAIAYFNLGNMLTNKPDGSRRANLQAAVKAYETALDALPADRFVEENKRVRDNLARINGELRLLPR